MTEPYYERDGITIWHGSCFDHVEEWTAADVLVSDPPYGIGWKKGTNNARQSTAHAGIQGDQDTTGRDLALVEMGTKPALLFGSWYAPFPPGLRQVLVWPKPVGSGVVGSTTGYRRDCEPVFLCGDWPQRNATWASFLPTGAANIASLIEPTGHPHTKPVPLMRTLIERCPPGMVADPFMGSGSTLVACAELGRRAVGVELEERYCEIAAERVSRALDQGSLFALAPASVPSSREDDGNGRV